MKKRSSDPNELFESGQFNPTSKLLFATLGAWITGKRMNVKVRGTLDEVTAITDALMATKRLHEELLRCDATVETITEKLQKKKESATEFERILGIPWPM